MKLRLPRFAQGLFNPRGDLPKLAVGGGWLFAVGSLFPLLWLIWFSGGGFLGAGYVFNTQVDGRNVSMPLLSYSGLPGFLLIWSQALLVSAAILLTAFPRYVPLRWRRVGHVVLVGWNALWTLGTWRLALVDPYFFVQAMFIAGLCGCTVYRAWRNWWPKTGTPISVVDDVLAPAGDENQSTPNYFSEESPAERPPTAGTPQQQIAAALERGRLAAMTASKKAVIAIKAGINAARDHSAKT